MSGRNRVSPLPRGFVCERLTVQEYLGQVQYVSAACKYKRHVYECSCACGNSSRQEHHALLNKKVKSCGCARNEAASERGKNRKTHGKSRTVEYNMWNSAKRRAAELGREFSIEMEDIHIPTNCPVLGIYLQSNKNSPSDSSPSLDRIDPNKGYVRDNIAVVSYRANRLKNSFTADEMRACLAYVEHGKETYKQKQ